MFWCSLMFFLSSHKLSRPGISEQALWKRFWFGIGFICLGSHVVCIQTKGKNFESNLIGQLCKVYGVQKSHTITFHPQGNGQCECSNLLVEQSVGRDCRDA